MRTRSNAQPSLLIAAIIVGGCFLVPLQAAAHCDTLDGPVVKDAKAALEKGDVTPVLKWVRKSDEGEIRAAFGKTIAVRSKGRQAKELADMYFFETLVRIHRAGEGAPYTGLKPAGTELSPAVVEADKALEKGEAAHLAHLVNDAVSKGMRERFAHAAEARARADETVEAGREFVAAYVDFVHYAERLYEDAVHPVVHHEGAPEGVPDPAHDGEAEKPEPETKHPH